MSTSVGEFNSHLSTDGQTAASEQGESHGEADARLQERLRESERRESRTRAVGYDD